MEWAASSATKDWINIQLVFEISNIQTFSHYSMRFKILQVYKRISFEYCPSCPP